MQVQVLKRLVSWFCLLYLTLYIPFGFMVYFSPWYLLNCRLNPISRRIDPGKARIYINELTGFFLHRVFLETGWSEKEKFHLNEVRGIFDYLAGMAIISLALLGIMFNKEYIGKLAKVNMLIILSLILILPFFRYFWVSILHPLLFNNMAWKTNRLDVSFYLLRPSFFIYSTIFLIISSFIENFVICLSFRRS